MTDEKFATLLSFVERLGNAYVSKSKSEIDWTPGWKDRLKQHYESSKAEAKTHTRNANDLLDRHKVAALMMIAIIRSDPFQTLKPAVSPRSSKARFWLAHIMGMQIVRRWILADIKYGTEKTPIEMHLSPLHVPSTMNGDGAYDEQTVRGLYQANKASRLDPFLLANILFMQDAFHRAAWKK